MNSARFTAGAALLLLLILNNAGAQERIFKEYNFAITPPPGWEEMNNIHGLTNVIDAFRSPDRMRLLMLMVKQDPHIGTSINQGFVSEFDVWQERLGNGKVQTSQYMEVGGETAYERVSQTNINSRPVSIVIRVLVADHKSYAMQGMQFEGNIAKDDETKTSMASFRFLEPPKHPFFNPNDQTAAFRLARIKQKYLPIPILIIGATVASVIVIKQRRKRQLKPPPLSPNSV